MVCKLMSPASESKVTCSTHEAVSVPDQVLSAGVDAERPSLHLRHQDCQMAKFDPFLSLDCARVEGVGAQSKERKGSNFAA